jgi:hypothetical protein
MRSISTAGALRAEIFRCLRLRSPPAALRECVFAARIRVFVDPAACASCAQMDSPHNKAAADAAAR